MIVEFINTYGLQLMYMLVTAVFGYLGIVAKKMVEKYLNDKTKRDVAKTAVQFVEQVYKDLHGPEKLAEAKQAAKNGKVAAAKAAPKQETKKEPEQPASGDAPTEGSSTTEDNDMFGD